LQVITAYLPLTRHKKNHQLLGVSSNPGRFKLTMLSHNYLPMIISRACVKKLLCHLDGEHIAQS
jgi:hypothetical protein